MGLDNALLNRLLKESKKNSDYYKEHLYKSYYGYIKGVIVRYIPDKHITEELINDCFIKIFNKIKTFKATEESDDLNRSFKSWIAKIASRTAIDYLRLKQSRFQFYDMSENHLPPMVEIDNYKNDSPSDIIKLIDQLPVVQKEIFNLYVMEGYAHEEISDILAIPINICRVYLSRAKNNLRILYNKRIES